MYNIYSIFLKKNGKKQKFMGDINYLLNSYFI